MKDFFVYSSLRFTFKLEFNEHFLNNNPINPKKKNLKKKNNSLKEKQSKFDRMNRLFPLG